MMQWCAASFLNVEENDPFLQFFVCVTFTPKNEVQKKWCLTYLLYACWKKQSFMMLMSVDTPQSAKKQVSEVLLHYGVFIVIQIMNIEAAQPL